MEKLKVLRGKDMVRVTQTEKEEAPISTMVFGESRAGPKKRNREIDMSQKDGNWSCLETAYLIGHVNISQPEVQLTYRPGGRKCSAQTSCGYHILASICSSLT